MAKPRKKHPTPGYEFVSLSPDLAEKLGLVDTPIPVRKTMVSTVFGPDEVRLRDVLSELDVFVQKYPLAAGAYREAVGTLTMIATADYIDKGNIKSALLCLGIGLRIDPGNMTLRVHQALALQMSGYHGAAADEYAQILNTEPQAYDPSLRVLAAKAFAAAGEWEEGLRILMFLPETAFADEGLASLRAWLQNRGKSDPDVADHSAVPQSSIAPAKERVCAECGSDLKAGQNFCTACGSKAPTP